MRRKRCPLPPEDSPKPDVSSLVDVSFLLLLFFLVTATIEKKEQELTTVIPATAGTPVPPIQTVRVEIDKMGVVRIGEPGFLDVVSESPEDRELSLLGRRLGAIREVTGGQSTFQLDVSNEVSHQRFTDVINCFAEYGMKKFEILALVHL